MGQWVSLLLHLPDLRDTLAATASWVSSLKDGVGVESQESSLNLSGQLQQFHSPIASDPAVNLA